jgi:hypothetical protein
MCYVTAPADFNLQILVVIRFTIMNCQHSLINSESIHSLLLKACTHETLVTTALTTRDNISNGAKPLHQKPPASTTRWQL